MIISSIQYRPRLAKCKADVKDNIMKCEPLVVQALERGSNFLVFPELCMTGCMFRNRDEAWAVAEDIANDPGGCATFNAMKDIASGLKSYVAWGFPELKNDKLFNSAMIIEPSGQVISYCQKLNLWGSDFMWASPGEVLPNVVETTDFGKISVIICRDMMDKIPPKVPRAEPMKSILQNQQVDIVAGCANWGKGAFPANSWMDFAFDNQCVLAISNRWGDEDNEGYEQSFGKGGSAIIEPNWKVHADGLEFGQDCVVTALL
jgi:predicted amidohydrolase